MMRKKIACDFRKFLAQKKDRCADLLKNEDGTLATTSAILLPMMLVLGGMSVDYMRFESERVKLQDVSDRAALAAANLEFTEPGAGVELVRNFFSAANMEQYLDGDPIITQTLNSRTVEVNATRKMNTFFLKLIGIEDLDAGAKSVATQGVGNVEISLVLDISGSMVEPTYDSAGNATGFTKIQALQTAARTFVDVALQDSNRDRVSLSLIPYATNVGIGPQLFDGLNIQQRHDFSHCVEFEDSEYGQAGIDTSKLFQTQHFDRFSFVSNLDFPNCSNVVTDQITPFTQDRDALYAQINALRPTTQTSIFLGMKWGLALLDPSTRGFVSDQADPAFVGRPADFGSSEAGADTVKVIVLMTDGENTQTVNLKDRYYNSDNLIEHFGTTPIRRWLWDNARFSLGYNSMFDNRYDSNQGDQLLQQACDTAASKEVEVYAVAFEAPARGVQAMANCASTVNHFFDANGDDLEAVFGRIAEQVTDLRLTQ